MLPVAVAASSPRRTPRSAARAARCRAGAARAGRRAAPVSAAAGRRHRRACSWPISGRLTRRHTSGGRNCATAAPARITGPIALVAGAVLHERPRVVLRHLVDLGGVDAEEVRRPGRSVAPGGPPARGSAAAAPARAGSGRRGRRPAGRTSRAPGSARTAPSPSSTRSCSRRRPPDVGAGLEAVHPQVHPVGVGPVDRVAQHGDQLRVRAVDGDPAPGVPVVEVERRALAHAARLGGAAANSAR